MPFNVFAFTLFEVSFCLILSWILGWGVALLKSQRMLFFSQLIFILPGFIYALFTLFVFRALQIEPRYGTAAISFAWVLSGSAFFAVSFSQAFADLDPREFEAMQSLGATWFQRFRFLVFKKTARSQLGAILQQAYLYTTSFSLVLILGGGPPHETLEVGIYTAVRGSVLNFPLALQLAGMETALLILLWLLKPKGRLVKSMNEWQTFSESAVQAGATRKWIAFSLFFVFALFSFYFAGTDFVLACMTGILFSGLVTMASCLTSIGFYIAGFRFLSQLGGFVSPMILSLLWWRWLSPYFPSFFSIFIIQVFLFSPWIARLLFPVLDRRRIDLAEAAVSLGASRWQYAYLIEWPRVKSSALFALVIVFIFSLGEVSSVILLSDSHFLPLSLWIQNSFLRYDISGAILGTAFLVGLSVLCLILIKPLNAQRSFGKGI